MLFSSIAAGLGLDSVSGRLVVILLSVVTVPYPFLVLVLVLVG